MNIISSPSKLSGSWYSLTPSPDVSTSYPKYIRRVNLVPRALFPGFGGKKAPWGRGWRRVTLAAPLSPATAILLNVFHNLISTGPQYIHFFSQWHSPHKEIYMRLFFHTHTLSRCQRLTSQWQNRHCPLHQTYRQTPILTTFIMSSHTHQTCCSFQSGS